MGTCSEHHGEKPWKIRKKKAKRTFYGGFSWGKSSKKMDVPARHVRLQRVTGYFRSDLWEGANHATVVFFPCGGAAIHLKSGKVDEN